MMSPPTQTIRVALSERAYSIAIGAATLGETGPFLHQLAPAANVVLITDANVHPLHGVAAADSLANSGATVHTIVVEPGEQAKSAAVAESLWRQMLELGADRKTVVAALGGGVVGDLAGFVAATYARGLGLLQIPTTLLAQVDSSVGGKVGINLPRAKNMVGAFWQPLGVLIDIDTLATLPRREYVSGLAEVVKYGVILDAEFFAELEASSAELSARQADVLAQVVARCCRLKANVVEADEREIGGGPPELNRAVLNYGHTFAHALETTSGYGRWLHGEAVSIGMMCAARLARRLGRVDDQFVGRQRELLVALGLPVEMPDSDAESFLAVMARDKKRERGRLRFVLPERMGRVDLVGNVSADDVRGALNE
jgi:3-dehydroquinate synthase